MPLSKIVQNSVDTPVAGTGPAFSAYQSSAQTLASATFTKIQFQTEEFDTANAFNNTGSTVGTAPSYSFNPQVAGYYQLSAAITRGVSNTDITFTFYKNNSPYKAASTVYVNAGSVSASALIYMNGTTDFVEVYGYLTIGQALAASISATYFQASMVRAA